jgi:hypothetical protein
MRKAPVSMIWKEAPYRIVGMLWGSSTTSLFGRHLNFGIEIPRHSLPNRGIEMVWEEIPMQQGETRFGYCQCQHPVNCINIIAVYRKCSEPDWVVSLIMSIYSGAMLSLINSHIRSPRH